MVNSVSDGTGADDQCNEARLFRQLTEKYNKNKTDIKRNRKTKKNSNGTQNISYMKHKQSAKLLVM